MDIKKIREDFGDCTWLRKILPNWHVESIIWLMDTVEDFEREKKDKEKQNDNK